MSRIDDLRPDVPEVVRRIADDVLFPAARLAREALFLQVFGQRPTIRTALLSRLVEGGRVTEGGDGSG